MARHDIRDWMAGLSPEERRTLSVKAGEASGAARVKHRLFKDILRDVLACPVDNDDALKAQLEALGLKANVENAMMLRAAHRAISGDIEAARFVRDTVGEKPTEAFNLAVSDRPIQSVDLATLTDQELQALAEKASQTN